MRLVIIKQHCLLLLTKSRNDASSLIVELVIIARLRVYGLKKDTKRRQTQFVALGCGEQVLVSFLALCTLLRCLMRSP